MHRVVVRTGRGRLLLMVIAVAGLLAGSFAIARAAGAEGTKEIVVEARQFAFEPAEIRVAQGQRVRITLRAMDLTHGLRLDEYGTELIAVPGRPDQVELVADKAGLFRFRCTQTCGPMHPFMVGKLVVEPNLPFQGGLAMAALVALVTVGYLWRKREPALEHRREMPSRRGGRPPKGGLRVCPPRGAGWGDARFASETSVRTPAEGGVAAAVAVEAGAAIALPATRGPVRLDLLALPVVGRFLRWRGFQFALMLPLLFFLMLALVAGLRGTPVGSHNLGIVFVWVVWWALLIIVLLPFGGRLWCAVCPVPGPGEWLQRLAFIRRGPEPGLTLGRRWPARLRNIWLQNATFLLIALSSAVVLTTPLATAIVLGSFFVLSLLLALVFAGRAFCRYVCPLGGFIGLCSLVAPLAVRVKDKEVCRRHKGKECIKGSAAGYGCPWFEYPGTMDRNAYCGLCMECVKTCPEGNIAVGLQPMGRDLLAGGSKGGRLDEAYRAFIALGSAALYSAVMLGPWGWLKSLAGNPLASGFALYAGLLLGICLVAVPGLFLAAVWLAQRTAGTRDIALPRLWQSLSYGLVPLALMAWIAFSLSLVLVSGYHVVPVLSDPLGHGWDLFGTAGFEGGPVLMGLLPYLQLVALLGGLAWSIATSWGLARRLFTGRRAALRALAPVTLFLFGTTAGFMWLYLG